MYESNFWVPSTDNAQEDVLQLVELSDKLRHKHKQLRIDFERTTIRDPPRSSGGYEEKFYERDVTYDSRRRNYR
jgi:hypothetical protein